MWGKVRSKLDDARELLAHTILAHVPVSYTFYSISLKKNPITFRATKRGLARSRLRFSPLTSISADVRDGEGGEGTLWVWLGAMDTPMWTTRAMGIKPIAT